jgi:hypothetical protein
MTTRTKFASWLAVAGLVLTACSSSNSGSSAPAAGLTFTPPDLSVTNVDLPTAVPEPPGPAAPTPDDAVQRFVAAEIAGDYAASWALLATDTRASLGVVAEWTRRHAQLPHLLSFRAEGTDGDRVVGTATLRPELNEVVGAVPERATVTWTAVAEDGGWRVAFNETRIVPEWPDDASAPAAVTRWVESHQRCEDPGALEYRAGLVGVAGLAERLCDASGETRVGRAVVLGTRPDPASVLAAFGPGADQWARTVELTGPVEAYAVVAPLGEEWVVIGLLT